MSAPSPYAPDDNRPFPSFLRRDNSGHLKELERELELHRDAVQEIERQAESDHEPPPPLHMSRTEIIARLIVRLPLHEAVDMAEQITQCVPDYKGPNKIELAMLFNEWARKIAAPKTETDDL